MRADRLLSLLMLLQSGGKRTAADLAKELGVSVRTIYRDLQALEFAGVPIYTESGPGGGCGVLEDYKTDLTGLTEGEVRALFLLSVPGPIVDLGLSQEFKGALYKLAAAVPGPRPGADQWTRQRVLLDWDSSLASSSSETHLTTIKNALWQNRVLDLILELAFETVVERVIEPYGLVHREGVWYLIYRRAGQFGVYLVSRIKSAELQEVSFERDAGFDLESFWDTWWRTHEVNRPSFQATAWVSSAVRKHFPERIFVEPPANEEIAEVDVKGRLKVSLLFDSFHEARRWILSGGSGIEVIEPEALIKSVVDYARQIDSVYDG